jgi:hypothetical protein
MQEKGPDQRHDLTKNAAKKLEKKDSPHKSISQKM